MDCAKEIAHRGVYEEKGVHNAHGGNSDICVGVVGGAIVYGSPQLHTHGERTVDRVFVVGGCDIDVAADTSQRQSDKERFPYICAHNADRFCGD